MRCGSNCTVHCLPAEMAEDLANLHEARGEDDLARISRLSHREALDVLVHLSGSTPEALEAAMARIDRRRRPAERVT